MTEYIVYSPEKFETCLRLNSERLEWKGKERGVKTLNTALSFDIETTSFYANKKKRATMYVWAFDIWGITFIGRTWEEFVNLISQIHRTYKTKQNRLVRIYVHNLSYEFQFMHKWFKWIKVFAVKARTVLYAITSEFIEFRCSYLLYGSKLETLAEDMNMDSERAEISKIKGYDYGLLRHSKTPLTPWEIEYVITDVKIVSKYILQCIKQESGGISTIPLTKTGYVRRLCRERCITSPSYKCMIHGMNLTYAEYITAKGAFAGGFTHSNPRHTDKIKYSVTSFDFASSYPAVMLSEYYPMSTGIEIKNSTRSEFLRLMREELCIVTLTLKKVKAKFHNDYYISLSKCEYATVPIDCRKTNISLKYEGLPLIVSNGRIKQAEEIRITITSIDFRILEYVYDFEIVDVRNLYFYHKHYLPKQIIETILDLYYDKTMLKGVKGKEEQYLMSKGMLNSMYGMSVTDILRNEYTYNSERSEWNKPKILKHMELEIKEEKIEKENDKSTRFLFYLWGCFVTAYARRNLWYGIIECGNDYIYSDTDSIKIMHAENHMDFIKEYNENITEKIDTCLKYYEIDPERSRPKGKQMGIWDFDGHYVAFKTLGAKRYIYIDDSFTLHITIAGLGKLAGRNWMCSEIDRNSVRSEKQGIVSKYNKGSNWRWVHAMMDLFKTEMTVPAGCTGKMTHSYVDEEFYEEMTDYEGNTCLVHEKSVIHLEDVEYKLSISSDFLEFLQRFIFAQT